MKITCINIKPFPINEIGPKLELNKEYELLEIIKCGCKQEHYNVGLQLEVNYIECYKCRERLPDSNHWCNSSRFKNINEDISD